MKKNLYTPLCKQLTKKYRMFNKQINIFLKFEEGSNYYFEIYCALVIINGSTLLIEKF